MAKATLIQVEPTFARMLGPDDEGRRLEKIIRKVFPDVPLSALYKALRTGRIKVNGKKRGPDYLCCSGELLEAYGLDAPESPHKASSLGSTTLPTGSIVLETEDLLFINKPVGLLVHDGPESLRRQVEAYLQGLNEHSLSFKPGPLHRLDRNTSGLVTFSKTLRGATEFSRCMRESKIRKTYIALLEGDMSETQTWEDLLARDEEGKKSMVSAIGQAAVTHVNPLLSVRGATLAEIGLETGRTHQIRAQAQAHKRPLVGDVKYGGRTCSLPYYLHSWKLEMETSILAGFPRTIKAPLPDYFYEFLANAGVTPENTVYSYLYKPDQQEAL